MPLCGEWKVRVEMKKENKASCQRLISFTISSSNPFMMMKREGERKKDDARERKKKTYRKLWMIFCLSEMLDWMMRVK